MPADTPGSIHMLAAIDRQRRAGDEIGLVGDQKQHRARDVLGLAEPSDRNARDDLFEHVFGTARTISVST